MSIKPKELLFYMSPNTWKELNLVEFQMTIGENIPAENNGTLSETPILDLESLFQKAESPDLPIAFYIVSGIWLCFTLVVGSISNGAVLLSFFRVQSVSQKMI